MSGTNTRKGHRAGWCRTILLLGALMQLAGWALPNTAQAQQYTGPYKADDLNGSVADTTYPTLNAGIAYAQSVLTAKYGATTSDNCYLVAVKKDPSVAPAGVNARVGYTSHSSDQGAQEACYIDHDAFYIYATNVGYDIGKNAGDCDCHGGNGGPGSGFSPKGSSGDAAQDSKGASPSLTVVGDAVNTATGNKYQQDTDFRGSPWLTFRRFYNSGAGISTAIAQTALGPQWRHSFDRSLALQLASPGSTDTSTLRLYRPDGRSEQFTLSNSVWTPDADIADTLTQQNDANGNPIGYTVFVAATRQSELYSSTGQLQSITDEAGTVTTLTYSTASTSASIAPVPNLLLTVTDPMGRTLQFTYDSSARVHTVTPPDGGVLTYSYDPSTGNLTSVQYPDGKTLQYVYNEASLTSSTNLPTALTGVVDEASTRFASTGYNSKEQVISATFAGGADATTFVYGYTGQGQLTLPLGNTIEIDSSSDGFGAFKVGQSSYCGNECNQPWYTRTYDANGYPKTSYDFNQNLTGTTYETNGLLDQEIDASGTANQRTTNTTWNAALRVPLTRTVKDNNGNVVASAAWVYNARGQATAECAIDPTVAGATSYTCGSATNAPAGVRQARTTYCDAIDGTQCPLVGLPLTVDGPRTDVSDVTTFTYYLTDSATAKHGDLKSVTDALGHTTTILSYDGAGRVLSQQDANGVTTTYTYYPRGWLHTRTVGSATTTITYTPYGAVQTVTDPDNVTVTYGYDTAHRLTDITDALGNRLHYTLDASGNRTQEQAFDVGGVARQTLTHTFNTLGQLAQVIDGLNHTVFDATYGYDNNGNLLLSSDALYIQRQHSYDALNRLASTVENYNGGDAATKNATRSFSYDALDRLTQVTDPSSLNTIYGYDGLSNATSLQSPDTGTSNTTYDAAGNVLTHTDAKSIVSTSTYDADNRLTGTSYSDSTQTNDNVTYAYDEANTVTGCSTSYPIGRLTRVIENAVTTVYCYDMRGNVVKKQQITASATDITQYVYSLGDRLRSLQTPDGTYLVYTLNDNGQIYRMTVTPPGGGTPTQGNVVNNVAYLPFGPIKSYTLGNGQTITRTYDVNYALSDLTSPALNLHFARDFMGNIKAEGNAPGANPAAENYAYDPLYQLKTVTDSGVPLQSFTYNSTGDRLSKTGSGLATGAYGYQANTHWLTSIGTAARTYDLNGNTTGNSSAGQTWGYGYNGRNRLTVVQAGGVTVGTYVYNAMGQRIAKTATVPQAISERYNYEGSQLIAEYGTTNRDYLWMSNIPVAVVDTVGSTSTINYITADHLGTPRAITNSAGATIWAWPYLGNAFGELAPTSTSGYVLNLRSPGQYYDAESGLLSNGFRTYCAECGRYIQSDPTGLNGGIDTYSYVGASPLNYVDGLGLQLAPGDDGAYAPTYDFAYNDVMARNSAITIGNIFTGTNIEQQNSPGDDSIATVVTPFEFMAAEGTTVKLGASIRGLSAASRALGTSSRELMCPPAMANSTGGLNLFKWGANSTTTAEGWANGDYMLYLPNQGSAAANWAQNAGSLRSVMNQGAPIYDSYIDPITGQQIPTGGFLNAERNLLESRGWQFNDATGAYHPPAH